MPAKAPAGTAKIAGSAQKGGGLNKGQMPMTVANGSVAVAQPAVKSKAAATDAVLAQTSNSTAAAAVTVLDSWFATNRITPAQATVNDLVLAAYGA